MRHTAALILPLLLLGCGRGDRAPASDSTAALLPSLPERVATAEGFSTPESAIYDPDLDTWFVTNINGSPSAKDGNGFISRLTADGVVDSLHFVEGGRDGVTLHAPKGQAIIGDTLWVTDIDAVRGFDKRTGAPLAMIEFGRRAVFLNDIAVGPDGALYITDTGIIIADGEVRHPGPDRVFRAAGRDITILAEGDHLERPNGIAWDDVNRRWVMVAFGGPTLFGWAPDSAPAAIGTGPGGQDGVVVLRDGRILVSSWADSTVFAVGPSGTTRVVTGVESPADIGLDPVRQRLGIPLFNANRVEFWVVP